MGRQSNHSKGVITLLNPTKDFKVEKLVSDKQGRFIILKVSLDEKIIFVLANIYAPNDVVQQAAFFKKQDALLAFSRDAFKWPHLFPLNRPRRFLKLCPCFAILAKKIALSCVTITDLPYRRISLLDLVPEQNLDLSNSCSIQSFRIKHEVIFLTNTFPCSSVPTVRLYPPFLCYSLSTKS